MIRALHVSFALVALTGYALAQAPPPAAGPGGPQGPGRAVLHPS